MYMSHTRLHVHVHVYTLEVHVYVLIMRDEKEGTKQQARCTCTLRQLIFSRKIDYFGCAVLLCLVCLFDLACFFLSSFSSLI